MTDEELRPILTKCANDTRKAIWKEISLELMAIEDIATRLKVTDDRTSHQILRRLDRINQILRRSNP